jgi:hypothetical protein
MKATHPLIFAAIMTAALAPLDAAVDLTPNPSSYEVEGCRFPCVFFRDGSQRIQYAPPAGWQLNGGGAQVRLVPSNITQADAVIEILPSLSGAPTTESDATLGRLATGALPRDAEKVEMLGTAVNPLRIERAGTVEFTLRYQHFGVSYQSSVLLMRRGADLWRFTFTARSGDFARLNETYRASLYSLQTLR